PDRLDALVYALSDLMLGYQAQQVPIVTPYVYSSGSRLPPGMAAGPNPFSDSSVISDLERAYNDPRNNGFTIKFCKVITMTDTDAAKRFFDLLHKTGLSGIVHGFDPYEKWPISFVEFDRRVHTNRLSPADREWLKAQMISRGMIA